MGRGGGWNLEMLVRKSDQVNGRGFKRAL